MSEKVKKTSKFLLSDDPKQDEKILEVGHFSNAMILKVADDILLGFCQTKLSSFNDHERFADNFIDKEIRLIDLANYSCNCHGRCCINTSRQINNACNRFIYLN